MSKILFLVGVVFLGATAVDNASGHPADRMRMGGRYLEYHKTPATWAEAMSICLYEGGRLLVDDNPYYHSILVHKANGELNIWLGATDLGHEGEWAWLNGVHVGEGHRTYWAKGEPNNLRGEHCLHMWGVKGGQWNDIRCDSKFPFFCQIMN